MDLFGVLASVGGKRMSASNTTVADATRTYLRYDGELGSGTDNYILNIGLRTSW